EAVGRETQGRFAVPAVAGEIGDVVVAIEILNPAHHGQSGPFQQAAVLLLMLEAADADLVSPSALKRSTLIFSYPQADRPITPPFGTKLTLTEPRSEQPKIANRAKFC